MSDVPARNSAEFEAAAMARWLADNGFEGRRVVKVLVLGNSGAGKSFACNGLVGADVFENRTQATSVTAANTFVAAVLGETAYVICNIPGLIEADEHNVPRNKAAIEAAFGFQRGCPTLVLFVASPTGGRVKNEDFQAIHAVQRYVDLDPRATTFLVNGVEWDEIVDPAAYRAEVEQQVRRIVHPGMRTAFTAKLPLRQRTDFECAAMKAFQVTVVSVLRGMEPVAMQPEEGAELVLEHERLKAEFAALRTRIEEQHAEHRREMAEQSDKWRAAIEESAKQHAESQKALQATIEELKNRPPQVVHVGGGGCFDAASTVVLAATGEAVPMSAVQPGDEVMAFDRRTMAAVPSRVLLVDRHDVFEVCRMCRFTLEDTSTAAAAATLTMTPEHLVWVQRAAKAGMAQAGSVAAGDRLFVPGSGGWATVAAVEVTTARPANVYTAAGTVVVSGVAASCYVVSEWWGWADMLPTRALAWLWPSLPGSPAYDAGRRAVDRVVDPVLYRYGWVRDRVTAAVAGAALRAP